MVEPSDEPRLNELRRRIEELNNKGTRVLLFLSFGIAATVLLWSTDLLNDMEQDLLIRAMRWWVLAILPTVIGILPLKEFRENSRRWYGFLRWLKFALLWLAIILIVVGATYFFRSISVAEPTDNTQSTMLRLELQALDRGFGEAPSAECDQRFRIGAAEAGITSSRGAREQVRIPGMPDQPAGLRGAKEDRIGGTRRRVRRLRVTG